MQTTGAMLLGRRTYEDLLQHWNKAGGPFKDMLNNVPKYVVSRTLKEPLPWPNSSLLDGELTKAVAALRKKDAKDIVILGSGDVVRKLLAKQLVDELILLIHPLVLGDGQRLFDDGGPGARFELADTRTTTTGVIAATYRRTDHGPKGRAS
jgi:dihydrofolate reductase